MQNQTTYTEEERALFREQITAIKRFIKTSAVRQQELKAMKTNAARTRLVYNRPFISAVFNHYLKMRGKEPAHGAESSWASPSFKGDWWKRLENDWIKRQKLLY